MSDEPEDAEEQEETEEGQDNTAEVETEARTMGWVPQEEFRGPKEQWKDAAEFVERGKSVLPIVNSLLKKEREKTSKLETQIEKMRAEWGDKLARLDVMSTLAIKKTEERIRSEYESKKEAAVERGDMDAYRAADKGEKAALADLETKAAPAKKTEETKDDLPPNIREAIDGWVAENPWFTADPELNALANAVHGKLLKDQPGLTIQQNLAKVRERVAEKFPEKFGLEDKPKRGSRVEGGSRSPGGGNGTLYGKLPVDAKQVCNGSSMGWQLYLKPGEDPEKNELVAKERWAKQYFGQPGVSQ